MKTLSYEQEDYILEEALEKKKEYQHSKYSSREQEMKHRQGFSKDRKVFCHPLGRGPLDIFNTDTIPHCLFCGSYHNLIRTSFDYICERCYHDL